MSTSTIRPCQCGSTPSFAESAKRGARILRLECTCGHHGATLLYCPPATREQMMQAAVDGWNLAER
jgi:hypothetical protein